MNQRLRTHDEVVIEQLRNPEMAKAYLEIALEEYGQDGDLPFFLEAQGGLTQLAEKMGLNDQNLYRVFSETGNPELRTISLILQSLGYRLTVQPIQVEFGK
jgi:probable addiction module antidote protein